ncbi:hypothetical protein BN1723_016129 [Verticillium longisporum]|uniref:Luciferase-like domain-containing protein n=1 Tax=Verticillium longisporum TaxID=100787 RepID=A0A0G4N9Q5_VERLO|nr:hypothetical protein BN1723_016129 [Verticillium longisporum]
MGVDFSSILDGPDLLQVVRSVEPSLLPQDVRQECLSGIQDRERAVPGDWLAIWGGSSTSANLAVQLARLAGLRVVTIVDKAKHGLRLADHEVLRPDLLIDSHSPARAVEIIRANVGRTRSGHFLHSICVLCIGSGPRSRMGHYHGPRSAKWFAFSTIYASYSMSSVFHGWVNTQLRSSPAQRSFTLVLINAISQSSTAWTPLLVFPTVEAPRYPKGFPFTLGSAILLIIATHALRLHLKRRDPKIEDTTAYAEEAAPVQETPVNKSTPVSVTGKRDSSDREMTSLPIHGNGTSSPVDGPSEAKKQILLNAFDMSTVGHLSPGQWKNPVDKSASKRDLQYWIDLAKLLERGGINALFLADTYGGYDTYEGSLDNCIRRAAQWPMTDPTIPISAMAAVTKNLSFAITASTSFEPPFLLAKRFSSLDHFTRGRIGWNIVTSWKKSAFKAIGIDSPTPHDERYEQADEYLRVLYKLWEGSWADDAIKPDAENDSYADPDKIRTIHHHGKFFHLDTRHIVDPSPQRTPFLFQAGTSSAGSIFAASHAEGIFVSSHSPALLKPKVQEIRRQAAKLGRDPQSVKFFATFTPIVGRTDEEAQEKLAELKKYASTIGGLVLIFHEVPAVGEALVLWLERLLESGLVKPPEVLAAEQGFDGVNRGLDRMRKGEISGGRMVVDIS